MKNLADIPSCRPDNARVPKGCHTAMILTVCCHAMFKLEQLYAATV